MVDELARIGVDNNFIGPEPFFVNLKPYKHTLRRREMSSNSLPWRRKNGFKHLKKFFRERLSAEKTRVIATS